MPDLRVGQDILPEAVTLDLLQLPTGLLDETMELQTAVIVALGTDKLANEDDVLPGLHDDDRRGWWGDLDCETIWGAWPIGSRLWLLERAKITNVGARQGATATRVETYTREALQPFIEHGIASKMAVSASRSGVERIEALATLFRGPKAAISLLYQDLWTEIGG